jgi:hypothetical protein
MFGKGNADDGFKKITEMGRGEGKTFCNLL